MQPEQPAKPAPPPADDYDFILNPKQAPKKPVIGGSLGKNTFILKLVFIIGGALIVMIAAAVMVNLFLSNKTNLGELTTLAATEQEIIRVSAQGKNADDQTIKNAAMNTQLTVKSHQQSWIAFLSEHGQKTSPQLLNLKKDAKTDQELASATQNSTFDSTFVQTMRSQLVAYASDVKSAYDHATNKTERALLDSQYSDIALLLKQWPEK